MKIFILFSLYFLCSLCPGTNLKELTDGEITRIIGSGLKLGTVQSSKLQEQDLGQSFTIQVIIADQPDITLNFTRVENTLINNETTIWIAEQEKKSAEIKYIEDDAIMPAIGNFTLYRDYKNEAAIVVFHDTYRIKGWVQNHRFENLVKITNGSNDFNEIFVLKHAYSPPDLKELTSDITYSEVLIQVAHEDVSKGKRNAVMTTIANWNAVDMFYSKFYDPPVRINIAGIILPKDKECNPWVTSNIFQNETGNYLSPQSLIDLEVYVSNLSQDSQNVDFEFIFNYVPENLDINATNAAARSSDRNIRVAIIRSDESPSTTAYRLGRLSSSSQDDEN
ncbi:uncharacterized protein [Fopius arisanus]|uniref:Uncharacterized protein isoform X2 n=1 Tax=Fopius arisanus TaxID=64838 RepID=A0A9R1T5P7_9HYME|nr:PREDICTED: uncharacterized protein LOC105266655 isoform X2 [Fopius arisanus]